MIYTGCLHCTFNWGGMYWEHCSDRCAEQARLERIAARLEDGK